MCTLLTLQDAPPTQDKVTQLPRSYYDVVHYYKDKVSTNAKMPDGRAVKKKLQEMLHELHDSVQAVDFFNDTFEDPGPIVVA